MWEWHARNRRTQELTKWPPPLLHIELQNLPPWHNLQQHTSNKSVQKFLVVYLVLVSIVNQY